MTWESFVSKYWKTKLVKLLEIAQNTQFRYIVFKTKTNIKPDEWGCFAATVSAYLNNPEKTLFEMLELVKNTNYKQKEKQKTLF